MGTSPMGVLWWIAQWPSLGRVEGQFVIVFNKQRMTGSGTGFAFGVICRLSAVIGVVSWLPLCTGLFRAARKYCTWRREVTHGGFDFFWNKPRILLMKEVKEVIGVVGRCKSYPEPVS